MEEQSYLQQVIEKYLNDKATTTEKQWLHNWFVQLGDVAHLSAAEQTAAEQYMLREKLYSGIQQRIRTQEQLFTPIPGIKKMFSRRWYAYTAAASVAVLLMAAGWWRLATSGDKKTALARNVFTRKGQLSRMVLPDSTVVWLNTNSHLRYPETFSENDRAVTLEGEAYFEVYPDSRHPFIIESGSFRTKVLGTSFSIRSYHASHVFQVTVTSGKVGVYNPSDSTAMVFLTANEQLNSDKHTLQPQVRHLQASEYLTWREGGLHFDKDPLEEVTQALENRYSVHFTFEKNSLSTLPVSGTFDKQDSLENVLRILGRVYHLQFSKKTNGDISIY